MVVQLDPSNLQSIVLQSHPCSHSRHFLFRSNDKLATKRFLAEWAPRVTHGGIKIDPSNPPCPIINIAIGWAGLDKVGAFDGLGGAERPQRHFPSTSPISRTISMRAYGPSAPENWWNKRFKSQDIELTVHVYCTSPEQLDDASEESSRRSPPPQP